MGYKIIAFQNCTKWANENPIIIVTINDNNWDEILQNYLKGNNPTNDKEWKKGVFAILFETNDLFNQFAQQWKHESKFIQSIDQKSKLNSYQQIIKMGKDAVPLILNDLKINGPNDWFYALSKITGENPITNDIAGNMTKMTQAWINWGNNQ